jgi:hypothetical protein
MADERTGERERGGRVGDVQKEIFGGLQKRGCCGNPLIWKNYWQYGDLYLLSLNFGDFIVFAKLIRIYYSHSGNNNLTYQT